MDMPLPRIAEDERLLVIEQMLDGEAVALIVTDDGGLVSLEAAREYFDVVAMEDVSDEALLVPKSMVERYLPDLPDMDEKLPNGTYRFLDRDYVQRDDGYVGLRNTRLDVARCERGQKLLLPLLLRDAQQIVDEVKSVACPKAIFPGGMVGGGKGTVVVREAVEELSAEGCVLIERDETRKRFFLYQVAIHPLVKAHGFDYRDIHHAISAYNGEKIRVLTDCMQKEGKSSHIIKDGTLSSPEDNLPLLKALSDVGYETILQIVLVPIELGKDRNRKRFVIEGRIVPDDVADNVGIEVMTHLVDYIASPFVHHIDVLDNSGALGQEQMLAECRYMDHTLFTAFLSGEKECIGCVMIKVGERIHDGKSEHKLLIIHDRERLGDAFRDAIEHGGIVPDEVIDASMQPKFLQRSFTAFDLSVLLYKILKKEED